MAEQVVCRESASGHQVKSLGGRSVAARWALAVRLADTLLAKRSWGLVVYKGHINEWDVYTVTTGTSSMCKSSFIFKRIFHQFCVLVTPYYTQLIIIVHEATHTIFFGPRFLRRTHIVPDEKKKLAFESFFLFFPPTCQKVDFFLANW